MEDQGGLSLEDEQWELYEGQEKGGAIADMGLDGEKLWGKMEGALDREVLRGRWLVRSLGAVTHGLEMSWRWTSANKAYEDYRILSGWGFD